MTTKGRKSYSRMSMGGSWVGILWAALALAPAATAATTFNMANGPVTISANGDYVVTGSSTINEITVEENVVANVILRNATINLGGGAGCALYILGGATVNLTLEGNNVLTSGRMGYYPNTGYAGVEVSTTAILNITAQSTGSLTATGGEGAAGIGQDSFFNERSGTVIIRGGTVIAKGNRVGSGIGAGFNGASGSIVIQGGNVTATGDAGIGGGTSPGRPILISGGIISATGAAGAGIGGGFQGASGSILISGGTVTAKGGFGAGIGSGGDTNACGPITISGGTVKATGSYLCPAIGGSGGVLRFLGGMVTATGGGQSETAMAGSSIDIAAGLTIQAGTSADTTAVKTAYRGEHYVRLGYRVLSVTPSRRAIGPAGGQTSFAVARLGAGRMVYTARETETWLRIVRGARGTNRGKIVVACLPNPGAGARTGKITVRAAGTGGSPKIVKIVQGGRVTPLLSVTPEIRRIGAAAGRTTFTVANKGGGVMRYRGSESVSWLRISGGATGGNRGTITITYQANPNTTARRGTITIAAAGANGSPLRVRVEQAGRASARSLAKPAAALASVRNGADGWSAAPELIDGDEKTVWTGRAGESDWAVAVDFGEVVSIGNPAIDWAGAPVGNVGWLGTTDLLEWFDLRSLTNWPVPCRALYISGPAKGSVDPPAIREIRWGD